jgi:hypothetical protein
MNRQKPPPAPSPAAIFLPPPEAWQYRYYRHRILGIGDQLPIGLRLQYESTVFVERQNYAPVPILQDSAVGLS